MAFSLIGWNGIGVISDCETTTGWAELGGGTFSANPDQFLQGAASIGSTYANKSGYTYYTHGTAYDFSAAQAGQKCYVWVGVNSTSSVDLLANDGLSWMMGADTGNSRHWKIAGSDDDNGWSQGWKMFAVDPTSAGSLDNGTYSTTAIDTYGLWIDSISAVRADAIFIDTIAIADGLIMHSGSGTFDEVVAYTWGTPVTRVIGVVTEEGRFNYSLGKITVGDSTNATADTTLTVTDKVIGFSTSEYWNDTNSAWYSTVDDATKLYNIVHLEKHATHATSLVSNNSSWYGNPNAWLTLSKDAGASYQFNGGTLEKIKAKTWDSNDSVENMVINDCESFTVTGGTFSSNTVSLSDPVIITGGTTQGNIFKNANSTAVQTTNLNLIDGFSFTSAGTGHAVELTPEITTNTTMNWNSGFSGYGADGTTDAVLLVNVASGVTLTINSSAGTPTYRNIGLGTVVVAANQVTLTITVKDINTGAIIEGARAYVYAAAGGGLAEGTPIIDKVLTDSNGQVSDTRSLSSNQPIVGRIRKSSTSPYYQTAPVAGTISSTAGLDLTIQMIRDE